jgi:tRNA acetyltransferase TAN1
MPDLLVSYSWHHFRQARQEVLRILEGFGDASALLEKTPVWGIAVLHTSLDNRQVIAQCRRLHEADPGAFQWAVKWHPVDYWCPTELDAMREVIQGRIKTRIGEDETWAMKVEKRRWQQYHTSKIIDHLAAGMERTVNLDHPDWIVWVDVVGRETAISLLRPTEIFSLGLPRL